ncbi:MAG TPA: phage portal protein [Ignavibacteria bacterium]|nr:phage portal protein [Ignavibacteria bacterium]HMQ98256.1 phage portal protein [Ignavibacteria bacterium]
MSTKTVKTDKNNIHIHLHSDVPDFAKNKVFHVKKGKVTSSYQTSVFYPGQIFNSDTPAASAASRMIAKASAQIEKDENNFSQGITPPVDPNVLAELRTYNAYHDRSIRIKTQAVAGMGYNILPVDESLENYDNSPNYKRLKAFTDMPNNHGEEFIDIVKAYAEDYYTFYSSYLELVPNLKGEIAEIYNMPACNVRLKKHYKSVRFIQKEGAKEQQFALFNPDRKKRDTELNEVLWLKAYYSKSKYYAVPDYYSAVGDIMLDRSSVEYNINRFKNGMMIDFMIIVEGGEVDSQVLTDINSFLSKNYKGVSNAGKALYLNSDSPEVKIHIEKVSADVKDASFLKQREFSRDVVMVAHGMNAKVWGLATAGQLGSGEGDMMFRLFEELIGKPDRQMFQNKLNKIVKYGLGIDDFYIELKELTVESWRDLLTSLRLAPFLTENEKRIAAGYEAIDDAEITPEQTLNKMHNELLKIKKQLAE